MNCFISTSNRPSINIATEEYLLRNSRDDFFILYRNTPTIIVGKHQNTLAEINMQMVNELQIPVIRRLSGGGSVYHDLGNLNFCFIIRSTKGELVNFHKYTQPILDVLHQLDVEANFEGRNDLTIKGMKFSGNASHVFKNSVIHHGTLLFSSDLDRLNKSLKVNPLSFHHKGIRSIRSKVTNIIEHLNTQMKIEEFAQFLLNYILNTQHQAKEYDLPPKLREEITKLARQKYETWEWNYGYSPRYNFEKIIYTPGGDILEINLAVEKGIIREVQLLGSAHHLHGRDEFKAILINCPHHPNNIKKRLKTINLKDYFKDISLNLLIKGLF